MIVIDSVYFEDQKRDTLIAGDQLKVDVSLLKLLSHKLEVNEINLQGITANVYRGKDSVFNFDYIIKAFNSGPPKPVKPADTSSSMKISLDKIILDRINIGYKDLTTGNDVKFILGHFDTRIKDFDMDKMKFTIPKITLSGVDAGFGLRFDLTLLVLRADLGVPIRQPYEGSPLKFDFSNRVFDLAIGCPF